MQSPLHLKTHKSYYNDCFWPQPQTDDATHTYKQYMVGVAAEAKPSGICSQLLVWLTMLQAAADVLKEKTSVVMCCI